MIGVEERDEKGVTYTGLHRILNLWRWQSGMVLFLNLSHNSFIATHIQFPFRDLFRYWVTVHLPSVLFPTISIFSQNWTSDKSFFLKKNLETPAAWHSWYAGYKNETNSPTHLEVEVMWHTTGLSQYSMFHCRKERMEALEKCQRLACNI